MEQKPFHYDGSTQLNKENLNETKQEIPFELTDEMRKSIGKNPYSMERNE